MLTIMTPLKTVLRDDLTGNTESFARRIMANYDQLGESISREDLFHLVTQPPEIFLMDGGANSYMSETQIHNTQMKKVEVINNLMNRILVSADGHLTYQDEVYITNVLHKLGIRDEKTFMDKVYNLTSETKNNARLIETYWNNLEELTQMISDYRSFERAGDTYETTEAVEEILHLHEDVFKRWMTGALYRIQNNFRMNTDASTYIDADSYRMTEEQRLSQRILLQRLQETVRGESVPLIYRHDNYYETAHGDMASVDTEAISEQIASAVLLSLVDNLYENIVNRSEAVTDRFYHTENAFYQAAEHVFERMEGNTTYIISTRQEADIIREETEQHLAQINLLNQERQEQYVENLQQFIQAREAARGPVPTDEDRIAESNFAFLHPEEFKEQIQREAGEHEVKDEGAVEDFIDRLPSQSREIYRIIRGFLREPERYRELYRITEGGEVLLYRDSLLNERTQQITKETERISEVLENDRIINRQTGERVAAIEERTETLPRETVRLIHRSNDVTVAEETIDNLRREIQRIENDTTRSINEVKNNETVTTTQVNNYNETLINEENTDQINKMIQESISGQIGTITSRVYSRIERQLMSERKRRGM